MQNKVVKYFQAMRSSSWFGPKLPFQYLPHYFYPCTLWFYQRWHHWLDGHESEWTPGVGDGQGGLACCDSWGRKESDTTERLTWTEPWHELSRQPLLLYILIPYHGISFSSFLSNYNSFSRLSWNVLLLDCLHLFQCE